MTAPINQSEPNPANPLAYVALGSDYDGAFADYACIPARHLYDVTASPLTDIEIAAMPCAFGTALNLLTRAGISAGQHILVTGASGGVGMAAVTLARHLGATMTAVTDPAKADAVHAAGATHTLPRDATPPERRFDAVIDITGGGGWAARLAALKPGGTCAVSGAIAGPIVGMDLRRLYLDDLTILGCTFRPLAVFAHLVALINAGVIRPLIAKTCPLADIATAQADFNSKRYPGKLVLIPPETSP